MANKKSCHSEEDLIGKLPNEVLTNILSFIDSRSAVATTLLSKRWNRLWLHVPNLDFTWPENNHAGSVNEPRFQRLVSSYEKHAGSAQKPRFERFVDRFLVSNKLSTVRTIHLHCHYSTESDRVNSWLDLISKRDAEKIRLTLPRDRAYCLPDCFFNQSRLVELIWSNFFCKVPQSVSFPSLRELHCDRLRLICDDDSLTNLLLGCPVLTYLYIEIVEWDHGLTLDVTSSTLLTLDISIAMFWSKGGLRFDAVIDTPNVRSIILADPMDDVDYEIRNVSSLVYMNLHLREDGVVLGELLRKMSRDRGELFLSFDSCPSLENMSMFHDLTKVTLETSKDRQRHCVPRLLDCTPNLVTFVLHIIDTPVAAPNCALNEPTEAPHCFTSSLENVEVVVYSEEFGQNENDVSIISYILKNAVILKNMHVVRLVPPKNMEREVKFLITLWSLPKSSAGCQLIYKGYEGK